MIDKEKIEKDYIDQATAAEILGVSRSRISKLCITDRFDGAAKIGWAWIIPRVAVENFKRLRPGKKPRGLDEKQTLLRAIQEAENLKHKGSVEL